MERNDTDPNLDYFLAVVDEEASRDAITGLQTFSRRFSEYRNAGRFTECDVLLDGAEGIELPSYGRAILRYAAGWMNDRKGQWEDAVEAYQESMDLFGSAGMTKAVASILWANIGSLYFDRGLWSDANEAYGRALDAACDERSRAVALNNLAGLYQARGMPDEAAKTFAEAASLFKKTGDASNSTAASLNMAGVLRDQGKYQDAQMEIILATIDYQSQGDQRGVMMAMASLALLYQFAGKLTEARLMYEQALPGLQELDMGQYVKALSNMALLEEAEGNVGNARSLAERSLDGYRIVGDRHGEAAVLINLARLCRDAGDIPAALSFAVDARRLVHLHGYSGENERLNGLELPQP